MTDLKLHDIEFSDIELQGGDGGGEIGEKDTIHLNPKKYGDDHEDIDDDDSDNNSDDADSYHDDDDVDDDDDADDGDGDDDDDDDGDGDGDGDDDDRDDNPGVGRDRGGSDDEEGDPQEEEADDKLSEDDAVDTDNFKKFNQQLKMSYVADTHPEAESHNDDEVHAFATVVRDAHGVIIDPLHKTIPILTKYEKTRILGMRTKQLNDGAEPYIKLPVTPVPIIDGYVIAQRELEEKKLPFIIRRPLPNGGTEYWYLQDLEIL